MNDSARLEDVRGLRVAITLYYYLPYISGLTIYVQRLAEDLVRRGAAVTVVASRHLDDLPPREQINGVTVLRSRPLARIDKGVVAPGLTLRTARLARNADVVIPVMPLAEAGAIALAVPRRVLLPIYVCDLRLGDGLVPQTIERVAAASARCAVSRARSHVVLSTEYARASRVVGHRVDRAVGVAPPVEASRYHRVDPAPMRARLGVGERPVVGFVGRLVYEKGLPVLVEAMRAVRQRHPDAVLAIAGEGRAVAGGGVLDQIEAEIRDDPQTVITGFLPDEDLLSFYSMCDVTCLPSIDPLEAYGMVQVEAMLCGSPVVASALPGVAGPVRSTGMGLLATPGDSGDLARAIAQVLDGPGAFVRSPAQVLEHLDPALSYRAMAQAVARVGGRA